MMLDYDSRPSTLEHIDLVQRTMFRVSDLFLHRAKVHDESKLSSPEKEVLDEYTPRLAGSTYGSDEYKEFLVGMKTALDHHYSLNSHHPEHYRWHCPACGGSYSEAQAPIRQWADNESHRWCPRCCSQGSVIWEAELMDKPDRGIRGMSLLDLLEMLIDWQAAGKRHKDGNILNSIEIGQKRFGFSNELKQILLNTIPEIEWFPLR